MLNNGSFTEGWTDLPPAPGFLVNQQPNDWRLRWIEPQESLFGEGDKAGGVPECVHKLAKQLPPHEQPGGTHALILAGDTTYKIFHASAPFGAELAQTVKGLQPGSSATLTVPIQVHRHGDPDPFGAESGVWVNANGRWVHSGDMVDRTWFEHTITFTVPDDGTADIRIRVKSKWPRPKDFFIDGITLDAQPADDGGSGDTGAVPVPTPQPVTPPTPPPAPDPNPSTRTIHIRVPGGLQVQAEAGDDPDVVVITVPPGFVVEVEE